jgi:hypothetical protein
MIKHPHYVGLEEARQLLAQVGCRRCGMQRAAEQDAQGRRKLPFFVDPIESNLKIGKGDLISIYFKIQVETQLNLWPGWAESRAKPCILESLYCSYLYYGRPEEETALRVLPIRSATEARQRDRVTRRLPRLRRRALFGRTQARAIQQGLATLKSRRLSKPYKRCCGYRMVDRAAPVVLLNA